MVGEWSVKMCTSMQQIITHMQDFYKDMRQLVSKDFHHRQVVSKGFDQRQCNSFREFVLDMTRQCENRLETSKYLVGDWWVAYVILYHMEIQIMFDHNRTIMKIHHNVPSIVIFNSIIGDVYDKWCQSKVINLIIKSSCPILFHPQSRCYCH